jgi:hypothetical protein
VPCLLSVLFETQVAGLEVSIGNIREPVLEGFVSVGIDRVVSNSAKAAFIMYEAVILQSIPSMFQSTMRDMLNQNVLESFVSSQSRECSPVRNDEGFIDFRDLLLPPALSLIAGGTGLQPYGDMTTKLIALVQNQFFSIDDDGSLTINSILIQPMTQSQSGVHGMVRFDSTMLSFSQDQIPNELLGLFMQRFKISLFDTRIRNIDTLMPPASALMPNNSPHLLSNLVNLGPRPDKLINVTLGMLLAVDGEDSPLNMHNEMDISASFAETSIFADLFATVGASGLLHFPLRDVLNPSCWLATLPAPTLDENGIRIKGSDLSLSLSNFFLGFSRLNLGVECIKCSSQGVAVLPELIDILNQTGATRIFNFRMSEIAEEVLRGPWLQTQIDRFLGEAPQFCPHHPNYNESAVAKNYDALSSFPVLSAKAVDTLLYSGVIMSEVAAVVLTESHRLSPPNNTDPLSAQHTLGNSTDRLLDWIDLSGSVGSFVDAALKQGLEFLNSTVEDGSPGLSDLGINILLRDRFLGEDGNVTFEFDDLGFELPGVEIMVDALRITGLDSISLFDVLRPVAPQTVQNHIRWDELVFELEIGVVNLTNFIRDQELSLSFTVQDVRADVPIFIALDLDKLGDLGLGSLLSLEYILPCLLSTLQELQVTEMLVSVGVLYPQAGGLLYTTDNAVSSFTQTLLDSFGSQFIEAIPHIFNGAGREIINGILASFADDTDCQALEIPPDDTVDSMYIDFRKFFDAESKPYGDLPVLVQRLVDSELAINDILVGPLTRAQSNATGSFIFPGDVFDSEMRVKVGGLDAEIQLRAWEARIENLDTFGAPLSLLDAVRNEPHQLNNTATLGAGEPMRFAVRLLIALTDDGE